jgi:hypothetical protein
MSSGLPQKIIDQIRKARLLSSGTHPFKPKLLVNRRGDAIIAKQAPVRGPKRGKLGYVDERDRIWIRDSGHADLPDHWDVQIDAGREYFRVDQDGNELP